MKISAEDIIKSCDDLARHHYREDGQDVYRLAYEIGLLRGKIKELCTRIEGSQSEIKQLQLDIMQLERDH